MSKSALLKENNHISHVEHHHDSTSKTIFGFWVYLMTDCVLFACLFAVYIVLQPNTYGGPSSKELFHLPFVLSETIILLTSSFTCGLSMLAAYKHQTKNTLIWLGVTFVLGGMFLGLELYEFSQLVHEGNSWHRSGFLSSYFTLVGTHGLHILAGLVWIIFLMVHLRIKGLAENNLKRLMCFSLFWHFLDIVWIFIFTIVYLMGAL